ncbi:MAG TPA: hypothetical protein VGF69_05210 [Thermoanaerobaculia bacterium]
MRRLLPLLLLLVPTILLAQSAESRRGGGGAGGDWVPVLKTGCIGGSKCPDRRLRIPLQDRPVIGVRFTAHDQIGETAGGELRVKIGSDTVRDSMDIPRRGETFTLDVDNLRGTFLVLEPASDDEVQLDDVAVLYGRADTPRRDIPRDRDWERGGGRGNNNAGWRRYPSARGCIGGTECKKNGTRIMVPLEDAPVLGIRFHAHDQIGTRADGRLNVRIDDESVDPYIDVQRNGKVHEIEVDRVRGSRLVIATSTDDEVEISDVEVLYAPRERRGGGGSGGNWRETTHQGGCIGGSECGGRRNRLRIQLRDQPVESIRFYAHDLVGARASGELRISIDDNIIRDYLDIPRDGKTFTFDAEGRVGDYLFIAPAVDDVVVVWVVVVPYRRV